MKEEMTEDRVTLENLIHFYEVKMNGFSAYSNIVWGRFNWFLTLELALIGFFFTQADKYSNYGFLEYLIPFAGLTISVIWGAMGFTDFHSVNRQKNFTVELSEAVYSALEPVYRREGENGTETDLMRQTRLLYLLPILVVCVWGILLLYLVAT